MARPQPSPSSAAWRLGGISFLHRFGSALNHHVHLHACVTDGVFVPATAAPTGDAPPAAGSPCLFDTLMERQQEALWSRFVDLWPETPLPELLGKTVSRQPDAIAAWTKVRERLGLAAARP
jgi:hypothetical protein